MQIRTRFLALLATLALMAPAYADYCEHTRQLLDSAPTDGVTRVELNVLAGSLEIRPSTQAEVSFKGRICTDEAQWLDRVELEIERVDGTLILTLVTPGRDNDFDADYLYVDVQFALPQDLPLAVRDSSGYIDARDIAIVEVDDSSGDIRIDNLRSDIKIDDSSGDIEIRNSLGSVEVSDSSGDIELNDIEGSVHVRRDSSGDIKIDTVKQFVTITQDSSGSIDIRRVTQDVEIGSDGSGDIRVREVEGKVSVGRDGSGTIRADDIAGDFELRAKGSGSVRTSSIGGQTLIPQ